MKKRWIAATLVFVMLAGVLCGCKDKDSGKPTEPIAPTGIVADLTIACAAEGEVLAALEAQIAAFMANFPGITVTLVTDTTMTEGEYPQILCAMPEEVYKYQKEGLLLDLDMWLTDKSYVLNTNEVLMPVGLSENERNDLNETYFSQCQQIAEDGTYMMPLYRQTLATFFNRTFFEENGMELPFSWENVELACEYIKSKDPNAAPLACNQMSQLFLSLCAQYGAEYTAQTGLEGLLNTEAAHLALAKINSWKQKGYLAEGDQVAVGADLTGAMIVFDSSASATLQMPAADNGAFAFELGVMNLPSADEGESRMITWGPGLSVVRTDDDDQMLAAWLLVRFLTMDVEFQAKLAMAGSYLPILTSVEMEDGYSAYLNSADGGDNAGALTALVCLEMQHRFFTAPVYENSAADQDAIATLISTCLALTGDVETGIDAAIDAAIG